MTNKPAVPTDVSKKADVSHPGMMGDGTKSRISMSAVTRRPESKKMRWMPPSASRAQRSRGRVVAVGGDVIDGIGHPGC